MAAPQAPYIGKKTGKVALDEAVFGESLPRAARAPRGGRRAQRQAQGHRVHAHAAARWR